MTIDRKILIGLLTLMGLVLLYLLPYGALDRAQAFGKYLNGGMSPEQVRYMGCIGKQDKSRGDVCKAIIKEYEGVK